MDYPMGGSGFPLTLHIITAEAVLSTQQQG